MLDKKPRQKYLEQAKTLREYPYVFRVSTEDGPLEDEEVAHLLEILASPYWEHLPDLHERVAKRHEQ